MLMESNRYQITPFVITPKGHQNCNDISNLEESEYDQHVAHLSN